MTRHTSRVGITALLLVGGIALLAGSAWAGTITVSVGAPNSAVVGSIVEVQATVLDDGAPVAGAVVALSYNATFAGVDGLVELARATTDDTGLARLSYQQRAADNGEMRVEYIGPQSGVDASATFTIAVEPGGAQLYRSTSGVSIPWLNATVVIGLITLLWSVIAYSAFQLVLIGHRGDSQDARSSGGAKLRGEEGSAWIGIALFVAAVITASGMVVVFVRGPSTHGNLSDSSGYTRTPLTNLGTDYPYAGFGLRDGQLANTGDPVHDGAVLWLSHGCAACHGVSAAGGPVAPDMSDVESVGDLTRKARNGPALMPRFPADVLSEEELAKIYAWLEAGSPLLRQQ